MAVVAGAEPGPGDILREIIGGEGACTLSRGRSWHAAWELLFG